MKKSITICLLVVLIAGLLMAGCTNTDQNKDGVTFVDALDRTVTIPYNPQRVVVLQGSFAKTWSLAGGNIIGVTPDAIEDLGMDLPNATLIGTVKDPNLEEIVALNPDFVIMSSDIADHVNIANSLKAMGIAHAYFKQESFEDYLHMLEIMTDITHRSDLYTQYGTSVQSTVDYYRELANAQTDKPSVLFVRARSQGVSAKATDHMVCTILDEYGCENIAKTDNSLLEDLSLEQIVKKDPDIILVTFMGNEDNAKAYLKKVWETDPAWKDLSAVKNNNYIFLQKDLFHFKPNEKWGQSYETLYQVLFQ